MPVAVPDLVKDSPSGGREQPGPPGGLITGEGAQAAQDLDPGLRGHILGMLRGHDPQVAEQGRIGVSPQDRERLLVIASGGLQQGRELLAHHMVKYRELSRFSAAK